MLKKFNKMTIILNFKYFYDILNFRWVIKYMYKYRYCITTAKKIDNLVTYSKEIEKCNDVFNEASRHARNYKNIITPVKFDNSSVEFILESENDLGDNPSLRPLLLLSKLLLDIEGLNEYYINKRFLKILVSKRISIDNLEVKLSDKEVFKCLVDVYMNNEKLTPYMNKLNKDIKQDIYKLVEEYLEKKE